MATDLATLVRRWKEDPGATWRTWFLWEERLENFRSIRRGLQLVADEIDAGTYGNAYRGSSLEVLQRAHRRASEARLLGGACVM